MTRRDLHLVLAIFLTFIVISFVVKHLVEDVIAPAVAGWECRDRPGDCAVMPKNRNGG